MTDRTAAITELKRRIAAHLEIIYSDVDTVALTDRLTDTLEIDEASTPRIQENKWDQNDIVLITYGNSIVRDQERPLQTLRKFLEEYLSSSFNSVHILPFFPYSSDDGFSVINYLQINDALGEWEDIEAIASEFRLMADLVINHASSRSQWFDNFKRGISPGHEYFVTADPGTDVSQVVRPRSSQLLIPVNTVNGEQLVWCTFGPDQVDLNFANPEVLVEFVNILARYLDAGARIIRLDAVAFLWKKLGTPCVHLQETHEIVKLLRDVAEAKCPDAVIITETNVPIRDNLTYFGNANEAHAIYNFSLPPLLIHTLLSGNCRYLKTWMMSMPPAQQGTCYLNFIASHDGVGLRPTEGLLEDSELEALLDRLKQSGGFISMRSDANDTPRPYEANISLWDALAGTIVDGLDGLQFERFICAHAIMLALEGIPAIYIHSLFGTPNDTQAVEGTGRYRSINRHVWDAVQLESELNDSDQHTAKVFATLTRLLEIRRRQPAFHPNAVQFTMHMGLDIFAFWRQSIDRRQSVFCLSNVTNQPQIVDLTEVNLIDTEQWTDLITGLRIESNRDKQTLKPYQTLWLSNSDG